MLKHFPEGPADRTDPAQPLIDWLALETLKALANFSRGPGPPCGQPARVVALRFGNTW